MLSTGAQSRYKPTCPTEKPPEETDSQPHIKVLVRNMEELMLWWIFQVKQLQQEKLMTSHYCGYCILWKWKGVGLGSLLHLSQSRVWFQRSAPLEDRDCLPFLLPPLSQNRLPTPGQPPTLKSFRASNLKLGQSPCLIACDGWDIKSLSLSQDSLLASWVGC